MAAFDSLRFYTNKRIPVHLVTDIDDDISHGVTSGDTRRAPYRKYRSAPGKMGLENINITRVKIH